MKNQQSGRSRKPWHAAEAKSARLNVLLIGPYDPSSGEYTFLAPPLGVWRLAAHLRAVGHSVEVFDPNCCHDAPRAALRGLLAERRWDLVGFSTTGMTLRYDLGLAHLAAADCPHALIVGGGMEATFNPARLFELGPFDLMVLGEGEKPLTEIARRLAAGEPVTGIPGTALVRNDGGVQRFHGPAMNAAELREAILKTPYPEMPYQAYWDRLIEAYRVDELPYKAAREARLAEIRSVRLITLNYCPMGCTFCSSTNFLHSAQGSVAKIARLSAADCLAMIERIVAAQPDVRTVIFQDDIFVFTKDQRILELCALIVEAKKRGHLPAHLEFISTNRIDAMTPERLAAMRAAGFRVLGFGIENFSKNVLKHFNKAQIHRHIDPVLTEARRLNITPFLDLILSSPRCTLEDLAENVRQASRWLNRGCEVGIYPYVIPFSGAAMSQDPTLLPHTTYETHRIEGTELSWRQPSRILPVDPGVRAAMAQICDRFEDALRRLERQGHHLPSRVRSLIWIMAAIPVLRHHGIATPSTGTLHRNVPAQLGAMLRRLKSLNLSVGRPALEHVA